jgi:hypothetical protein
VRYFSEDFHAEHLLQRTMVAPAKRPPPSRPASASLGESLFDRIRVPGSTSPQRVRPIIAARQKGI